LLHNFRSGLIEDFEYMSEIGSILYELSRLKDYYVSVYPVGTERFRSYDLLQANSPITNNSWLEQAFQYDGAGYWLNEVRTDYASLRSDFYYIRPIRSLTLPFDVIGVMS